MKRNSLKYLSFIATILALASCSSISALPKNGDTPLVELEGEDVNKNNFSIVYDKLVEDGTVNSTVLNDVMYIIAKDKLELQFTAEQIAERAAFDAEVDELVDEKLYDIISTGSYDHDYVFNEMKYVVSLRQNLYDIVCPGNFDSNKVIIFGPDMTIDRALQCDYSDYKDRALKKEVYRELLVAKYLQDEKYSTLGRAYARQISYIALPKNNRHPDAVKNLMDAFIADYVGNGKVADLNFLARVYKGTNLEQEENDFIAKYNLRTLLDDITADYQKVAAGSKDVDPTLANDFTGNATYAPEKGLLLKTRELEKKEVVKEDWFIKNGGLTDLPDAIRERVFDIRTSNDNPAFVTDEIGTNGNGVAVRYLLPQDTEVDGENDFLLYDRDSGTYFLIQIEDALNATQLTIKSNDSIEQATRKAALAHEVAKCLAARDAYKSEATIHYLREAGIVFHDEDIYQYFLDTHGDMFEEEE